MFVTIAAKAVSRGDEELSIGGCTSNTEGISPEAEELEGTESAGGATLVLSAWMECSFDDDEDEDVSIS